MERTLIYFAWDELGALLQGTVAASTKKREVLILQNNTLPAAIYVDPMNRVLLTEEQTATAKECFFKIALRMEGLGAEEENPKN